MNEITKEVYSSSGMEILSCALSLQFLTKDLAEMETIACRMTDGDYSGLTNLIELLADKIRSESKRILELSE